MSAFDDALTTVMDGLKNGSITPIKRELRLLDTAHMNRPQKSFKRWAVVSSKEGRDIYVCEDGTFAQLLKHCDHHDDISAFLPIKTGEFGDKHVEELQSLLVMA